MKPVRPLFAADPAGGNHATASFRASARARHRPGDRLEPLVVETVTNARLSLPAGAGVTHLQFRRFAGCPVCTLHLRSFIRRHAELVARGVREVVVFNSSREAVVQYHADVPFPLVADPGRTLYHRFGVERHWVAVLDPASWPALIRGALAGRIVFPEQTLAALELPADFLLAPDGTVAACRYGRHADDQWSVDEVLTLSDSSIKQPQKTKS